MSSEVSDRLLECRTGDPLSCSVNATSLAPCTSFLNRGENIFSPRRLLQHIFKRLQHEISATRFVVDVGMDIAANVID
jgi:hypothetical protein